MQITLHNHVLHTFHCLVEQIRIRSVRKVDISFFGRIAYKVLELVREEVLRGLYVSIASREVRKVFVDRCFAGHDLLLEEIHLVQEENERRLLEVFAVSYALEEHERFMHLVLRTVCQYLSIPLLIVYRSSLAYAITVFNENVIVSAYCDKEQHDLDIIEDVYPLLAL